MWLTEDSPGLIYFPATKIKTQRLLGLNGANATSYYMPPMYLDALKQAASNTGYHPWTTTSSQGSINTTGEEPYLQIDSDYNVTSLIAGNGFTGTQVFNSASTWMFLNIQRPTTTNNNNNWLYSYTPGTYQLTFSGPGSFYVMFASNIANPSSGVSINGRVVTSTLSSGQRGSITFDMSGFANGGGIQITSLPNDNVNYIKLISCVPVQYLPLYNSGEIFHPNFKAFLASATQYQGFNGPIRFMDAMQTIPQSIAIVFNANLPAGAVSGTASYFNDSYHYHASTWKMPTTTQNVVFANGQIIPCTFTYGSAVVQFSQSLSSQVNTSTHGCMAATARYEWAFRPKPSNFTWAGWSGIPLEVLIHLCNEVGNDGWFCIPAVANWTDSTFSINASKMLKDGTGAIAFDNAPAITGLRNDKTCWIELDNETWNYQYVAAFLQMMSDQMGFTTAQGGNYIYGGQEFHGVSTARIADAFTATYGSAMGSRAVVVCMTQGVINQGPGFMKVAMNTPDWTSQAYTHGIGAYGCATYFGIDGVTAADATAIGQLTYPVDRIIAAAWAPDPLYPSISNWALNELNAIKTWISQLSSQPWSNLPIVSYEGGPAFDNATGLPAPWWQICQNCAEDSRMANLLYDPNHLLSSYDGMLEEYRKAGIKFICYFADRGVGSAYQTQAGVGNWGLVYSWMGDFSILGNCPSKYQGAIGFINGLPSVPLPLPPVFPYGKQSMELYQHAKRKVPYDSYSIPLSISSPATPPPPVGTAFPRTASVNIAGDSASNQSYPPTPYSSQVTNKVITTAGYFAESAYSSSVPWMGRYDIVIIGGNWEGWDGSGTYDRGLLVDAIKQITHVTGYSSAAVWQYVNYEERQTNNGNAPYNTMFPVMDSEPWLLYGAPNQTGSPVADSFGGGYSTNWAVAWPNAVGSTPADHQFSPGRTVATYNGQPEDMMQYAAAYFIEVFLARHSSLTTVASGTIQASSYTDSRFYPNLAIGPNDDAMKAPNIDALYTDNLFCVPQTAGYYDLQNNYTFTYTNTTPTPWLLRGAQHFQARCAAIESICYPGRSYVQVGNIAQFCETYWINQGSWASITSGINGSLQGGLIEALVGASYSFDQSYGGVAAVKSYQVVMDLCVAPKQVIVHGYPSTATDWQTGRYTLAMSLMDSGYCALSVGGSYKANAQMWLDEFGGNPGTNVAKGWLGQPIGSRPAGAAVNGVWIRDFTNGVALFNPRQNLAQTVTAAQINAYLGTNYSFSFIQGIQNTSLNSGQAMTSVSMADADGVLLRKVTALTPDQDFANRAAGAGVIAAWKLNSQDPSASSYINPASDGYVGGSYQTSVKVLSGGALQFKIPAGRATQDLAGNWNPPGRTAFGGNVGFGAHSTMYVQYMCCMDRMESNFESHWYTSSGCYNFKLSDIFTWDNGGLAYDSTEITLINGWKYPFAYTDAANYSCQTQTTSPMYVDPNPSYLIQQDWANPLGSAPYTEEANGLGNIPYGSVGNVWPQGDWFTIDIKATIGTMNSPSASSPVYDSSIEVWQTARNSQIRRKCVSVRLPLFYNAGYPSTTFNTIMLTPYCTNNSVGAPTDSYIWYTGLIISSQPIPLPSASIPAPTLP